MLQLENVEEEDWEYAFRRKMQKILPGIFLGPFSASTKSQFQTMMDHGITHIICIRHHLEARFIHPNFPQQFKYLVIEISDEPCANIIKHFPSTYAFIDEALQGGGGVLVHGNNGVSRSASIVVAYIMVKYQTSFNEAYKWVRDRRCCVMPNSGFLQQLKEYEPIYKAQLTSSCADVNDNTTRSSKCMKRQFED